MMTPETLRILSLTPEQVTAEWIERQRADREAGRPHYTVLRNSDRRGAIVATIDGGAV